MLKIFTVTELYSHFFVRDESIKIKIYILKQKYKIYINYNGFFSGIKQFNLTNLQPFFTQYVFFLVGKNPNLF